MLLAVCDADILGKTFTRGEIVFHVHEKFYKGNLVSQKEALNLVQQSTIVNMVGKEIVKKAIKKGLVHPDAVLEIGGVPHAQLLKF